MMRKAQHRPEAVFRELLPVVDGGLHHAPPRRSVLAQRTLRFSQAALKHHGGAIVERVRQRRIAVYPMQSEIRQRQRSEKRRTSRERMHGRAEVVQKTRQRERERARRATRLGFGLEDLDTKACLREHDGCGKPVGTRSDHAGALHRG
jgi:uncharacterized protein (DUF305 family)